MYYKFHKINVRISGSLLVTVDIDSPESIKKKKATANQKDNYVKCFQYVITVALNYGEIESHTERVLNRI